MSEEKRGWDPKAKGFMENERVRGIRKTLPNDPTFEDGMTYPYYTATQNTKFGLLEYFTESQIEVKPSKKKMKSLEKAAKEESKRRKSSKRRQSPKRHTSSESDEDLESTNHSLKKKQKNKEKSSKNERSEPPTKRVPDYGAPLELAVYSDSSADESPSQKSIKTKPIKKEQTPPKKEQTKTRTQVQPEDSEKSNTSKAPDPESSQDTRSQVPPELREVVDSSSSSEPDTERSKIKKPKDSNYNPATQMLSVQRLREHLDPMYFDVQLVDGRYELVTESAVASATVWIEKMIEIYDDESDPPPPSTSIIHDELQDFMLNSVGPNSRAYKSLLRLYNAGTLNQMEKALLKKYLQGKFSEMGEIPQSSSKLFSGYIRPQQFCILVDLAKKTEELLNKLDRVFDSSRFQE